MTCEKSILPPSLAVVLLLASFAAPPARTETPPASPRVPVLVELFTSEGCSDCPPADALLAQLDSRQPFSGVQAIVLSEHVTYWDRQGWRDPFSLDQMTDRQQDYVHRFGLNSSYTPQMIVDGSAQFVGGDGRALIAALTKAAAAPKSELTIENPRWDHGKALFSVHAARTDNARLIAVLASDAVHSEVSRGENAGRTLHHTAVVRTMKEFNPNVADGRPLELAGGPLAQSSESAGPVRLVVFLSDRKSGHVLGAAEQVLTR